MSEKTQNRHRLTMKMDDIIIRLEASNQDSLASGMIKLEEQVGAIVSRPRRDCRNSLNDLAQAVAEHKHVSYDRAKEWIDRKELENRGFKIRLRKEPAIASLLAEIAKVNLQEKPSLLEGIE